MLHTLLTVGTEGVQEGPPETDGLCAEREGLEHIRRAAHTTVDIDLEVRVREQATLLELVDDLDENFDA